MSEEPDEDFIVTLFVPLRVRMDSMLDADMAVNISYDYLNKDPITGEDVVSLINKALDPTAFHVGTIVELPVLVEHVEADDSLTAVEYPA